MERLGSRSVPFASFKAAFLLMAGAGGGMGSAPAGPRPPSRVRCHLGKLQRLTSWLLHGLLGKVDLPARKAWVSAFVLGRGRLTSCVGCCGAWHSRTFRSPRSLLPNRAVGGTAPRTVTVHSGLGLWNTPHPPTTPTKE